MYVRVVRKEKLGEWHSDNRAVWLRKWRFDKVRYFKDGNGEVDLSKPEIPFVEVVYSLFVVGNSKSLWLNENAYAGLIGVLADKEEEEFCPTPPSVEDEIAASVVVVKRGESK